MYEKTLNVARKYGAKIAAGGAVALASVGAFAQTDPMTTLFDAVDFTSVSAKVIAAGVIVLGIAMAFKGIDLGKRTTKKA